jgi:hypothetical protein
VAFATALVKVHALWDAWEVTERRTWTAMAHGQYIANLSSSFVGVAREVARASKIEAMLEKELPHPTDTHPPLRTRLDALDVAIADVLEEGLNVRPPRPAITLFGDDGYLEGVLTDDFYEDHLPS